VSTFAVRSDHFGFGAEEAPRAPLAAPSLGKPVPEKDHFEHRLAALAELHRVATHQAVLSELGSIARRPRR
jgi:hypothetical protein